MAQYNLSYTGAQVAAAISYAIQVPTLQSAITSNATAIATETSQRTTADTNLQSQITENSDDIAVNISEIADLRIHKADITPTTGATSALRALYTSINACTYNSTTNLYAMNGLTDITEAQMAAIFGYTASISAMYPYALYGAKFRTNYPLRCQSIGSASQNLACFTGNTELEVFNANNHYAGDVPSIRTTCGSLRALFNGCTALTTIIGYIDVTTITDSTGFLNAFNGCAALRTLNLYGLKVNVSFASSSNLSMASLAYMINNSAATSAITITLHSSAYSAAQSDTSVQSALLAKPLVTLAQA